MDLDKLFKISEKVDLWVDSYSFCVSVIIVVVKERVIGVGSYKDVR